MNIKINILKFACCILILISYPSNYYMMLHGQGAYNNDPNYSWTDGRPNERATTYQGPSPKLRFIVIILSPITAPINGIYTIAKSTCKKSATGTYQRQQYGGKWTKA